MTYSTKSGIGGENATDNHPKDRCEKTSPTDRALLTIGLDWDGDDLVATNAARVHEQMLRLAAHQCGLVTPGGQPLTWEALYTRGDRTTLLGYIEYDRLHRVDRGIVSADRPPFAVATLDGSRCVRLEWYQGHDALGLAVDLRSPTMQDRELEPFLAGDPDAYDPIEFMAEVYAAKWDTAEAYRSYWSKRGYEGIDGAARFARRISLGRRAVPSVMPTPGLASGSGTDTWRAVIADLLAQAHAQPLSAPEAEKQNT